MCRPCEEEGLRQQRERFWAPRPREEDIPRPEDVPAEWYDDVAPDKFWPYSPSAHLG